MNFFDKLNAKLQSFMLGRNGSDRLGSYCLGAAVILLFINIIFPNIVSSVLSYAFLFYAVYRMFSSNVSARQEENARFEGFLARFKHGRGSDGSKKTDAPDPKGKRTSDGVVKKTPLNKKDAVKMSFTCESCGQSLSVPKGKGTLKVTCPKCHHQTTVRS